MTCSMMLTMRPLRSHVVSGDRRPWHSCVMLDVSSATASLEAGGCTSTFSVTLPTAIEFIGTAADCTGDAGRIVDVGGVGDWAGMRSTIDGVRSPIFALEK